MSEVDLPMRVMSAADNRDVQNETELSFNKDLLVGYVPRFCAT